MDKDKFDELIERANQGSKDDFLRFVTGIYGIDECVFEHMWEVPVIASCDEDSLVTTSLLQKQYKELIKENSTKAKPKTQEELDQIFVDYAKGVITQKRCYLNANYFVTEVKRVDQSDYSDRNEALVDILGQMMNNYQEGDSIEDCLFKIIKDRDGKSQYTDLDDREVLTMYTLFPEELTEWATFGAYDFIRENKLQKMIMDVCGTDTPLKPSQLKKKVEEYVTTLEDGTLSDKQTEMLEMLGFSISKKIDKEDSIKKEEETRTLYNSNDILKKEDNKVYENNYDTENKNYLEVIDNKPNFIKRIFNKILSFFKKINEKADKFI